MRNIFVNVFVVDLGTFTHFSFVLAVSRTYELPFQPVRHRTAILFSTLLLLRIIRILFMHEHHDADDAVRLTNRNDKVQMPNI